MMGKIGASGYKGVARRVGKTIHRYHVVIKQKGKGIFPPPPLKRVEEDGELIGDYRGRDV